MDEKTERKYMDSFRDMPCEACGAMGSTVGAHLNFGQGGTGYRAKGLLVGLCGRPDGCHDMIDRRGNWTEERRTWVLEKALQKLARDRAMKWKENQ